MNSRDTTVLVDEKVAISLFLDSLLQEPDIEIETPEKVVTAEVTTLKVDSSVKTEVEIKEIIALKSVEQENPIILKQPECKDEPFQALLFTVAGLKLAIPLVELSGVIKWTDKVTEMPGHADFYMGILQHLEHKIPVIDAAKMVLPVNRQAQLIGDVARKRVKHIVLIGNYQWGLACDKIGDVITLEPEGVRWRSDENSRTWLAGTVIEHMCALLNAEGFAAMLKKNK